MREPQMREGYLDFDIQAVLQSVSSAGRAWSSIVISYPCFYLFASLGLVHFDVFCCGYLAPLIWPQHLQHSRNN